MSAVNPLLWLFRALGGVCNLLEAWFVRALATWSGFDRSNVWLAEWAPGLVQAIYDFLQHQVSLNCTAGTRHRPAYPARLDHAPVRPVILRGIRGGVPGFASLVPPSLSVLRSRGISMCARITFLAVVIVIIVSRVSFNPKLIGVFRCPKPIAFLWT